jgi:hypothetical protein
MLDFARPARPQGQCFGRRWQTRFDDPQPGRRVRSRDDITAAAIEKRYGWKPQRASKARLDGATRGSKAPPCLKAKHIPLNSHHHPNKKVRYSPPSIPTVGVFRENQDVKGEPLCGA